MDYRNIAILLLKLAGVVVVIHTISSIPAYFLNYYSLQQDSFLLFVGIFFVPFAFSVFLGFALWLFPAKIANTIVFGGENSELSIDAQVLQTVAYGVLGMWVLVKGVADAVY